MTFEVIQADGQPLRFDDSYFWEYFAEEMADTPPGDLVGRGATMAAAILDLLEQEEAQ